MALILVLHLPDCGFPAKLSALNVKSCDASSLETSSVIGSGAGAALAWLAFVFSTSFNVFADANRVKAPQPPNSLESFCMVGMSLTQATKTISVSLPTRPAWTARFRWAWALSQCLWRLLQPDHQRCVGCDSQKCWTGYCTGH